MVYPSCTVYKILAPVSESEFATEFNRQIFQIKRSMEDIGLEKNNIGLSQHEIRYVLAAQCLPNSPYVFIHHVLLHKTACGQFYCCVSLPSEAVQQNKTKKFNA